MGHLVLDCVSLVLTRVTRSSNVFFAESHPTGGEAALAADAISADVVRTGARDLLDRARSRNEFCT